MQQSVKTSSTSQDTSYDSCFDHVSLPSESSDSVFPPPVALPYPGKWSLKHDGISLDPRHDILLRTDLICSDFRVEEHSPSRERIDASKKELDRLRECLNKVLNSETKSCSPASLEHRIAKVAMDTDPDNWSFDKHVNPILREVSLGSWTSGELVGALSNLMARNTISFFFLDALKDIFMAKLESMNHLIVKFLENEKKLLDLAKGRHHRARDDLFKAQTNYVQSYFAFVWAREEALWCQRFLEIASAHKRSSSRCADYIVSLLKSQDFRALYPGQHQEILMKSNSYLSFDNALPF